MSGEILKHVGTGLDASRRASEAFRAGLRLLDQASANIAEAGEYFATIDALEWDGLVTAAPPTMRRTLNYVRAVGQGIMIPQLATESGEGAGRLRSMPLELQRQLYFEPVEMFKAGATGRHAKYLRHATEMTSDEVAQAFERSGRGWKLRSYDEQRAWLAGQDATEEPHGVDRPGRWAVRNGRVYLAPAFVSKGLTRKQLENILHDMEEEES